MAELLTVQSLIALLTLTALEVVLGIDNIVFLVLVTGRLDPAVQGRARRTGLVAAMVMRILLLLGISWIMGLIAPLFSVAGHAVSGRDLILLAGGAFLIAKATLEIHHRLEESGTAAPDTGKGRKLGFGAAILQVMLLDLVFSLDSVITAVGMARHVAIMIAAVIMAVAVMLVFSSVISRFIEQHPSLKMLALAFLLLVGVVLVAEGCGRTIEKGYIYFAMAFSLGVELLNLRAAGARAKRAVAARTTAAPGQPAGPNEPQGTAA